MCGKKTLFFVEKEWKNLDWIEKMSTMDWHEQ